MSQIEIDLERKRELIDLSPLFGKISLEAKKNLATYIRTLAVDANQRIAIQGEPVGFLFIVAEGIFEVMYRDTEHGLEYKLPELNPGDEIGLTSFLYCEPYLNTVRATTKCLLLSLSKNRFEQLCKASNSFVQSILDVVVERQYRAESQANSGFVVDLPRLQMDERLLLSMPRNVILKYQALPLVKHGSVLVLGMVDPTNLQAIDELRRFAPGMRLHAVPIDALSFQRFYRLKVLPAHQGFREDENDDERWYKALRNKTYDLDLVEPSKEAAEDGAGKIKGEDVIELMNRIIGEALELMASDIHIEAHEHALVVRYRVDGRLKTRPVTMDIAYHSPLVSRFKVFAGMDIAERRKPQDGRLTLTYGTREIHFRLATVPTLFGEKLVLRILDPQSILIQLERLVPRESTYRMIRKIIEQPQGMMLIAGPTGSGKTTTIYSALLHRKEDEVNIVTIENPIEYSVDGIAQVQVNEAAGITFATSVRAFLRQDPDIIVVGETRDPTTAATSLEAALTGHLVLTTIHANDAMSTVVRLREMGIEPFLVANTVIGVVSQRLVRRICTHCRESATYHRNLILPLGIFNKEEAPERFTFYRGKGCVNCNYLGFRGRAGVFEVLIIDDAIRPLIAGQEAMSEVAKVATAAGLLQPLTEYAKYLLVRGITTPEEITRILFTHG